MAQFQSRRSLSHRSPLCLIRHSGGENAQWRGGSSPQHLRHRATTRRPSEEPSP
ncbi:hypothetical protein FM111_10900 [Brevundimonas diminuta 3F5N]|uniref:Uncharacterized protein n=1 Tax=Brevundimonas diminuta 3F5N TaxID=1255603 RepID=A0A1R4GA98_BREDI|nr:hypothetical protein FM111_10900 [Brevundimonas diminuta 3F5N]